jgi:predicted metallopeptidase
MVQTVDQQLRKQRLSANDLTAPTRRAYLYLSELDANSSAPLTNKAATDKTATRKLRFPGLQGQLNEFASALSSAKDQHAVTAVGERIARYSGKLEQIIAQDGIQPSQLSDQARSARGWLAWLSDPQRQQRYQQLASRLQTHLSDDAHSAGLGRHRFSVQFRPVAGLYRIARRKQQYDLRLATAMLTLPEHCLDQLGAHALRLSSDKQLLITAMQTPPYQAVLAELDALGGRIERSCGHVHDLSAAFTRINQRFFNNRMQAPRLSWSGRQSYRKLGHYESIADAIVISSALDSHQVPETALDFVIYHELLHKQHGAKWSGGRAHSHTPAFRRDERRYPDKDNIEALLAKLGNT